MGEDGGVEAGYSTIGEAGGVSVGAAEAGVVGEAEEELGVRLEGEDGKFQGEARAEEAAVGVGGEIGAGVARERERAEFGESDVEADDAGWLPVVVGDADSFGATGAVDGELRLGVQGRCGEGKEQEEEEAFHVFTHVVSCDVG